MTTYFDPDLQDALGASTVSVEHVRIPRLHGGALGHATQDLLVLTTSLRCGYEGRTYTILDVTDEPVALATLLGPREPDFNEPRHEPRGVIEQVLCAIRHSEVSWRDFPGYDGDLLVEPWMFDPDAAPRGYSVREYRARRLYGGPEEGGWYYTALDADFDIAPLGGYSDVDDALLHCREMNAETGPASERLFKVERWPGEFLTTRKPVYC